MKTLKAQVKQLFEFLNSYLFIHLSLSRASQQTPEQTAIRFWNILFSQRVSVRQLAKLTCQPDRVSQLIKIPPLFKLKQVSIIEPSNSLADQTDVDVTEVTTKLIVSYERQTIECLCVLKLKRIQNAWRIDFDGRHQVLDLEAVFNAMLKVVTIGLSGELPANQVQEVSYPYDELRRMH